MPIAILTFDGYNELDSFVALGILNRIRQPDWRVTLCCPGAEVTSMNGVTVRAQSTLEEAHAADAVIVGSGLKTREVVSDPELMARLRLHPVEVISAEALQLPLWDGPGEEDRMRARRALVRVQGLLGAEAVKLPMLSGGRGPVERITLTPLGDEQVPRAAPDRPWPGRLPEPAPTVLLDDPVELLDARGDPVRVSARGMFTTEPARLHGVRAHHRGELSWWAGPWPADGSAGPIARAQVLVEGCALLLCYRQRRWYVEGAYE